MAKCHFCYCRQGQYVRTIATNGTTHYWLRCMKCKKNFKGPGKYVRKSEIEEMGILESSMPIAKDNRGDDVCIVVGCESRDIEWNHFMPTHLMNGDEREADRWPILTLCREHHQEWYNRVTPFMNGTNKIVIINFCPICQKRVDHAAVLDIRRPLSRWNVHCCNGAWAHITSDKDGKNYVVYMAKAAFPPGE